MFIKFHEYDFFEPWTCALLNFSTHVIFFWRESVHISWFTVTEVIYMNYSKDLTDLSKLEEVLAEKLPISSPVQGK